jgi:excisionase family DNA binding protein
VTPPPDLKSNRPKAGPRAGSCPSEVQDEPVPLEPLLNVRQAAAVLHLSERHVWRAIQAGDLEVMRFGRAVRIQPEALRGYIRQHRG